MRNTASAYFFGDDDNFFNNKARTLEIVQTSPPPVGENSVAPGEFAAYRSHVQDTLQ